MLLCNGVRKRSRGRDSEVGGVSAPEPSPVTNQSAGGWIPSTCTVCDRRVWRESLTSSALCIACGKHDCKELAAMAPPPPPLPPPPPSVHSQPTFSTPSDNQVDDLGLSLSQFREIQLLQAREITEDDYDLLMLLHSKPNTKVLSDDQICAACVGFQATGAAPLGDCTICLGSMSTSEALCRLTCKGGHVFHRHCVTEWLRTASRCCPICQQDLSTAA